MARASPSSRDRHRQVEQVARETGACGIVGDVGRKEEIHPIALEMTWNLGGLDALINNASSLGPTPLALLADTECEEFQRSACRQPHRPVPADQGPVRRACRRPRARAAAPLSSTFRATRRSAAYPGWGAYGASKAALTHMTAIWAEEAKAEGVKFLSLDPGDMDTPLHALAVPDADPTTLKRPEDAASEIVASLLDALGARPACAARMTAAGGSTGSSPSSSSPRRAADPHLPRAALASLFAPGRSRRRQ